MIGTTSRPRLSKDFVLETKRTRIMEAAARVVCQRGVDGAKISILTLESGVARKTFYEIFAGKDDCLEQTLSWVGECAYREMVEAKSARAIGNTARVRYALGALLDFAGKQPHLVRFYLLHGPTVSLQIFEATQESFGSLLNPLDGNQSTQALVVGAVAQVLRRHFHQVPGADPRFLLKGLTDFVASSIAGDPAREAVAA